MKRLRSMMAVALSIGASLQAEAQTVSYAQSTFTAAQWAFETVTATGPISVVQGLAGLGGNPGDAWVHSWSIPSIGGITGHRVANINSTFTYDPSVYGALGSLTFEFDVLGVTSNGFTTPFFGFFVPVLRQGGVTYFSAGASISPTREWSTFTATLTGSTPWVLPNDQSNTLRPDFSAAGEAMEFGYLFSVNTNCNGAVCSAGNLQSRLDNFSVSATAVSTTVPEPASLALLATGLAGLGVVAGRRRRVASR